MGVSLLYNSFELILNEFIKPLYKKLLPGLLKGILTLNSVWKYSIRCRRSISIYNYNNGVVMAKRIF
ncbi:hypothetical protein, partial [Tenebrionicola larvae]